MIAPSSSYLSPWLTDELKTKARQRLESMGFIVTFGKHLDEIDDFESSPVESRLDDLHDAFADPSVAMISCIRGGHNSNQLLRLLDYGLIAENPKILCGFSDITALSNAIYAKTGLVGYSSPNFYQFSYDDKSGAAYTVGSFTACLMHAQPYRIEASGQWHVRKNEKNEETGWRTIRNPGPIIFNAGRAEGRLLGGNLCTFQLLKGTEYFPDIRSSILFLEDDYECHPKTFDRDLVSIIQQPGFDQVRGLVIGRFEPASRMTDALLRQIIETKAELKRMPVIANVDFGHTQPAATFPIGGSVRIDAGNGHCLIEVLEH